MSRRSRQLRLLVVPLLIVLAGSALSVPTAQAGTTGRVGGSVIGTTATCVTSAGILTSVKAPAVKVKMRSAWSRTYRGQYVKVTARLQGRVGTTWANVTSSGARVSKTVLVRRSYVSRYYAVPALAALRVPAAFRDHYRVALWVQWYSPRSGKVEGTVTKTVSYYRWGTATTVTCPAATAPKPVTDLAVVATGTSGQARATFGVAPAPLPQAVQCSPSCGTLAVPAAGQAGTTAQVAGLADGVARTVSVRSCLVRHPTLCGGWVADAGTPYGPLPAPTLAVTVNGQCLNWNVAGTGQGKSVTAVLRMDGTAIDSWSGSGNLGRAGTQCVGYSQTRTFQVTITDSAATSEQPSVRPSSFASRSAGTGPPPPSIRPFRGASRISAECPYSNCSFLGMETSNFATTVTCRIVGASFGDISGFIPWSQGPNETRQSPNYAGGPPGSWYLVVQCGDGTTTLTRQIGW